MGISTMSRRRLLGVIGSTAGAAAMYQAMTSLGLAKESPYRGAISLDGDPKGASVVVLGAGLAGLVSALELRKAGYKVTVLEYREKAGGRNWSLRGGDVYTELGGVTQTVGFDDGLYINPGPWRLPYHHHAILDYCKRLGVALEPFVQVNHNAYLHSTQAYGGKPQRFRHVQSDMHGQIGELLAKATNQGALDDTVTAEDREKLLEALKRFGALDSQYRYRKGETSSEYRGFEKDPGGGLTAVPEPSQPLDPSELLSSELWKRIAVGQLYEFQMPMFQPVGGMDMISRAFQRELEEVITFNRKVVAVEQGEGGVTVRHTPAGGGPVETTTADWCICTIPFSVLSQVEGNFSTGMRAAMAALPYGASVKMGLQFKRRFWEEDDSIYGGISYTDLPISSIGYPSTDFFSSGKGVVLGGYVWGGPYAYELSAMDPAERVRQAVKMGAQLHPQYTEEFETGVSVAWHRVPWTLGCYGAWTEETRKEHYETAASFDGRTLMAGEHISYIPAWQEGAVLSALDATTRLHARVMQS